MPEGRELHSMHIGTPLSPTATKVMLLGSGELGKEVIIALQRFGVEVIAVDRYANAPGHQVAHRAHVIAMTDAAMPHAPARPAYAEPLARETRKGKTKPRRS